MTGESDITFRCRWVIWDGANADELRSVAGDRVEEIRGGVALYRRSAGTLEEMTPGWVAYKVVRADGTLAPRATVCAPQAWAAMGGPQADLP